MGDRIGAAQYDLPAVHPADPGEKTGRRADDLRGAPPLLGDPFANLGPHRPGGFLSLFGVIVPVLQTNEPGEGRVAQFSAVAQLLLVKSTVIMSSSRLN